MHNICNICHYLSIYLTWNCKKLIMSLTGTLSSKMKLAKLTKDTNFK